MKIRGRGKYRAQKNLNLNDKTLHVIFHMHANGALMTEEGN